MNLKQINNQMKSYINEASFIGNKCRNKLIELVNKKELYAAGTGLKSFGAYGSFSFWGC